MFKFSYILLNDLPVYWSSFQFLISKRNDTRLFNFSVACDPHAFACEPQLHLGRITDG